ncbi:hypothetical protein GLOIN_2v1877441 [Rhizophagus irregularis DAOM 181602=DAOM 197198]|nr:hypothetical protein GLOIN_2v1877441 [Rhizophagus irregularis DAOM 181602=DAOM 197198]
MFHTETTNPRQKLNAQQMHEELLRRAEPVYLYSLNDKRQLNEYGINLPSNPLFNYPSFIQHLDTNSINECIIRWLRIRIKSYDTYYTDKLYFIPKSLIKLFSEKEAKLRTLNFTYQHDYDNYTDIIISELVLQNSNLIGNIKNLYFEPYEYDNMNSILKFLNSKCDSISSIYLPSIENHNDNSMELILQKSGDYLENFVLSSTNSKPQLLELITSYCTKIKFLELNGFYEHHQDIYSTFNLIETFKQNLNYLTINTSIEYIMKKKRVKYIAFRTNDHPASGSELSRLKDEVKEFRLHDIIVQDYRQMKIKFIEFLKEKI